MSAVTDADAAHARSASSRNTEGEPLRIEQVPRVVRAASVTREERLAQMADVVREGDAARQRYVEELRTAGNEKRANRWAIPPRGTMEERADREMQRQSAKHGGWCARCGNTLGAGDVVVVREIEPYGLAPHCVGCVKARRVSAILASLAAEPWEQPDREGDCESCGRWTILRNPWAWNRRYIYCCAECRDRVYRAVRKPKANAHSCDVCGVDFTPARSDSRTCSNACRQRAYRTRKAVR